MSAMRVASSKFGATTRTLSYLDRRAYTRGTEELTRGLKHSMKDEWARADVWTEHWGLRHEHSAIGCWGYVNGDAATATATPGVRDVNNVGVGAEAFRERANAHIRARKPGAEAVDLLTLDETLSVRLYTGPAYQPINTWLRRVGQLESSDERRAAALDPSTSYGATVGQLVAALRKLAVANTREENERTLYRGLKGRLPASFWLLGLRPRPPPGRAGRRHQPRGAPLVLEGLRGPAALASAAVLVRLRVDAGCLFPFHNQY